MAQDIKGSALFKAYLAFRLNNYPAITAIAQMRGVIVF